MEKLLKLEAELLELINEKCESREDIRRQEQKLNKINGAINQYAKELSMQRKEIERRKKDLQQRRHMLEAVRCFPNKLKDSIFIN